MRFAVTEDQRLLAGAVGEALAATCPPAAVREAGRDPAARRAAAWQALAEVGLLGALVPEEHGGLGLTIADTVLAYVETGRHAVPGPLVESAVAAPSLVGPDWLVKLAAGVATVSVAMPHLLDADLADLLVVRSGAAIVLAEPGEITLIPNVSIDATRRLFSAGPYRPGPPGRKTHGTEAAGGALASDTGIAGGFHEGFDRPVEHAFDQAFDRAALATAAQLIGLGRWLLDASVAHARRRRQFGAAVGSFQAVKHRLADVAIALEFAAPVVYRAAYALTHRTPTARRDVAAAKIAAGEAAGGAARGALQVHGAAGYTGELDLHLWLTRVWALRAAWGDESLHRARLRDALLGDSPVERLP
ncbi:acyl-CoA dehydrogenase family protein [Actinomadura alba]|uniref:Acyl-CoA/acyl-ACP dehydrogenase n=1 Tax=Actinomadura alba TaxID=406431 RepID=A0ABR7LI29_9ACTN|nr:acyl-CoA dehydrogenase family protein [Actinomadura alba]MBC6464157.1 acyl-CoA/acyl-ACP dehydrogenase [Actinomadura alba]